MQIDNVSRNIQGLSPRRAAGPGNTPCSGTPIAEPGETFQGPLPSPPKQMKNLSSASDSLLTESVTSEAWSFTAGSMCMVKTQCTPGGKLLCQDQEKIYCLDGNTGNKEWDVTKPRGGVAQLAIGPDGTAYLNDVAEGAFVAIDSTTGLEKWRADLPHSCGTPQDITPSRDGVFVGSLVSDDKNEMSQLVRLHDPATGAAVWEKKFKSNLCSSLRLSNDGKNLLVNLSTRLTMLDPLTGKSRWSFPTKGMDSITPSIGPTGHVYYRGEDHIMHALDGRTGKPGWEYPLDEDSFGMPEIDQNGTLYARGKGKLAALDGNDGKVKWEIPTAGITVSDVKFSSDGKVHIFDKVHNRALMVDAETGAIESQCTLKQNWTIGEMSPDGHIYYTDNKKVHALKVEMPEDRLKKLSESNAGSNKENEPAEVEVDDGFVFIDGMKLPINTRAAEGRSFYLLR